MTPTKTFKSPAGDIRVALLNGQCTTISSSPKELPECFWAMAYSLGAISGEMEDSTLAEKALEEARLLKELKDKQADELLVTLKEIYAEPGAFVDKSNNPVARKVAAKLGRPVSKPEVMKVWNSILEAA